MVTIGSWNVRGLNSPQKQFAVCSWLKHHNIDIFGLLETRILPNNLDNVQAKILPLNWSAISNIHTGTLCRILVGWNPKFCHLQSIDTSAQWITSEVHNHPRLAGTRVTFVYGSNSPVERRTLWQYIKAASEANKNNPWIILGDFNAVLRPSDRSGGSTDWGGHHGDFPDCIMHSTLQQLPYTGMHLTWHNGQNNEATIMKKLDWVFGNLPLMISWPNVKANFIPRQASDHSAMVVNFEKASPRAGSPFKFLNQWASHEDFLDLVRGVWTQPIAGNPLFQLTTKLNILKAHFKSKHRKTTSHLSLRTHMGQRVIGELAVNYFKSILQRPSGSDGGNVWQEVTLRAIINWPALPWERAWEWAAKEFTNRSNPNQNLVGMILAATIYHLWAERNNRLHMQVFCSAKHTTDKTLNAIRDKIASLGPFEVFWAELEALVAALDCGWTRCLFISKRLGCGWARCLLAQWVFYFGYRLGLGVSGSCLPVGVVIGLLLPVEVFKGLVLPGGLFFLWAWAEAPLLASFLVSSLAFLGLFSW
ncbi:hypothetical protein DKX38_029364 [Salix brachista]|uniref:Endonuclease/exonuclease/phosphatase domain-containing protein n=1 Tax=Salix brachista TaxID=2182728 RepID=A0A5N5J1E1_9ROSI|nr:hypothetical protein DKX38_029364 [Salix brachista]